MTRHRCTYPATGECDACDQAIDRAIFLRDEPEPRQPRRDEDWHHAPGYTPREGW